MSSTASSIATKIARTATLEVLGEGVRSRVPIPREGATVASLLRAAGVPLHGSGWELFVDGVRRGEDHPLDGTRNATVTYAPRTRGA